MISDILESVYHELIDWTHRSDDALRIPDVVSESADALRRLAREINEEIERADDAIEAQIE